jgi:hypothetical protein
MAEVLSKLSARLFFPGGTLPSGPLMPALPLCTAASIIRREWVAFSHIMPCVLVLVASIGALVLVAAVLSKFGSGSRPEELRLSISSPLRPSPFAVWDRKPGDGPGGTDVQLWREEG